mgnify:CR=1 FL=1
MLTCVIEIERDRAEVIQLERKRLFGNLSKFCEISRVFGQISLIIYCMLFMSVIFFRKNILH